MHEAGGLPSFTAAAANVRCFLHDYSASKHGLSETTSVSPNARVVERVALRTYVATHPRPWPLISVIVTL